MEGKIKIFLLLSVFGLFVGSSGAQTHSGKGDLEPLGAIYDQSKNETTVRLSRRLRVADNRKVTDPDLFATANPSIWQDEGIRMSVYFKSIGNTPKIPEAVTVKFDSVSSADFKFEKNRGFVVITDSSTLQLGELKLIKTERETSSRGISAAYYVEELEGSIPLKKYLEIVNSRRVRIQIGEAKFTLEKDHMKELKEYADRLMQ
jgi:hypothetical protein